MDDDNIRFEQRGNDCYSVDNLNAGGFSTAVAFGIAVKLRSRPIPSPQEYILWPQIP